jgi:precorrin-4/cobalt-precorrin-4 C11-methyltransferase
MVTAYFIGAGPGDIELLTLKAVKIIRKADVIIYAGSLIDKGILRLARKNISVYDSSRMNLDEICRVFKKAHEKDKVIARIHSGDPSIYGAIGEQMDFCDKENIRYEVIPGVSSFQAAAASLKREFTSAGISQTIILARISGRTKVMQKEDLAALSKHKATMAIFLSIQHIRDVVDKLRQGYPADTPIAVVEKVSLPDERKILGNLTDIVQKVEQAGIKRQALIIVGDVLAGQGREKSKLYDKNFEHGFRKISGV